MEENEFGMSMFKNMDIPGLELNLDDAPDEIKKLLGEEYNESSDSSDDNNDDDTSDEENINLNEGGENQTEEVVEEEEQEEGDSQDDSPNIYSSFADVLVERGLLPSLDLKNNKILDADGLIDAIKIESENTTKQYIINKLGEDGYEALEKGITLAEYQNHVNTVQTLDKITDDNLSNDLELSKNIILQDYINQGITEDRALKLLKKTIDLGEESIIEDAKESLVSLKEMQAVQLQKLQDERQTEHQKEVEKQEKIDNDLKNTIYKSKEIIEGLKIDKAVQDKVYQSITKVVGQSPSGIMENKLMRDRRQDPINFDTKLYYLYELTNGFKDFSKLISKSESKAVSKLEQTLRQTNFKGQGNTPTFLGDPNSYGGSEFGSELVL